MNILQVSAYDRAGGAAQIAWSLLENYRHFGHRAFLAVGHRQTEDPDVLLIDRLRARGPWSALWTAVHRRSSRHRGRIPGAGRVAQTALRMAEWDRRWSFLRGEEDFDYPDSHRILDLPPVRPDLIHCHNLHGAYFDPRALPAISRSLPVVVTLHDQWLFTGHCAYVLGCERWKAGCGECPSLKTYPAIGRDRTHENWLRKRELWRQTSLYLAAPSRWLLDQIDSSILAPACVEKRCIPNGVDLEIFHPDDGGGARRALGIPADSRVLLFVANGGQSNPFKDLHTVKEAVQRVTTRAHAGKLILIALGGESAKEPLGFAELWHLPFEKDSRRIASLYQACDLYVHGALTDNFPQVILEALACGKPVLASAVGGIPEQIRDWRVCREANGGLVPARNPEAMAAAVNALLEDSDLLGKLGAQAARDARAHYDSRQQARAYLSWYQEILVGSPSIATSRLARNH